MSTIKAEVIVRNKSLDSVIALAKQEGPISVKVNKQEEMSIVTCVFSKNNFKKTSSFLTKAAELEDVSDAMWYGSNDESTACVYNNMKGDHNHFGEVV